MRKAELLELIANGENSGVEFKRDDIRSEQLAKEIVAFANLKGGYILLGVEDDGSISGLQRDKAQEWVLNVFRDKVFPQTIPYYEELVIENGKKVAVITVSQGISKPYVVRHNNREDIYIRMGNRSELATREQQARLFESGGLIHVEVLPVAGTSLKSLDLDRIRFYLESIVRDTMIPATEDTEAWKKRLNGLGWMADDGFGNQVCTIAGLVCFGKNPRQYLRQSGIRLMAFNGPEKVYQAKMDIQLDGPLVGRYEDADGIRTLIDDGLIEKMARAIQPFIVREGSSINKEMRRETEFLYPWEAIREVVINALVHRDWTRTTDVEVVCYSDRIEITSPGTLQNSMTIEKMLAGQRSPRNPIIVDILRDYGYVDARGMGIRNKVVPLMRAQNNADPKFELTEDFLRIVLPKRG
ncbi:MAG TPA: putative DNA binding domain-containing protein [Treponemataceae bacterium]|nr:putative DNA binding domain-containing protein [Treponemataceae bacterium]